MPSIVAKIPLMTDQNLLNLFGNAIRRLAKEPDDMARHVIAGVAAEWKNRRSAACFDLGTSSLPHCGVLATLGFHVGNVNGERTPVRRLILTHVIESELPFVCSLAYMDEWGAPNTSKRYWKLVRFLRGQIANPAHRDMEKAMIEWREDLAWVQHHYAHLAIDGEQLLSCA